MPKCLTTCNAIKATAIGGTLHAFKTLAIRGSERSNSNFFLNYSTPVADDGVSMECWWDDFEM